MVDPALPYQVPIRPHSIGQAADAVQGHTAARVNTAARAMAIMKDLLQILLGFISFLLSDGLVNCQPLIFFICIHSL
jgi:hypothetical protein